MRLPPASCAAVARGSRSAVLGVRGTRGSLAVLCHVSTTGRLAVRRWPSIAVRSDAASGRELSDSSRGRAWQVRHAFRAPAASMVRARSLRLAAKTDELLTRHGLVEKRPTLAKLSHTEIPIFGQTIPILGIPMIIMLRTSVFAS